MQPPSATVEEHVQADLLIFSTPPLQIFRGLIFYKLSRVLICKALQLSLPVLTWSQIECQANSHLALFTWTWRLTSRCHLQTFTDSTIRSHNVPHTKAARKDSMFAWSGTLPPHTGGSANVWRAAAPLWTIQSSLNIYKCQTLRLEFASSFPRMSLYAAWNWLCIQSEHKCLFLFPVLVLGFKLTAVSA